jgi:hypothetical protein
MRASSEGERFPSTIRWLSTKHAVAMMLGGKSTQRGVRYLPNVDYIAQASGRMLSGTLTNHEQYSTHSCGDCCRDHRIGLAAPRGDYLPQNQSKGPQAVLLQSTIS